MCRVNKLTFITSDAARFLHATGPDRHFFALPYIHTHMRARANKRRRARLLGSVHTWAVDAQWGLLIENSCSLIELWDLAKRTLVLYYSLLLWRSHSPQGHWEMRPPLRTISLQQGTNTARSEEQFAREFRFEVITAAADEPTKRFGSSYGPIRILKGTHKSLQFCLSCFIHFIKRKYHSQTCFIF